MKRGSKPRGFSLVEVILACALTSLIMVVLGEALVQAQGAFRNVAGTSDASDELRKVSHSVRRELQQTSATQIGSANSRSSLGPPDGQALWFLSNFGTDQQPHFMSDGSPFWQRNILYYVVVPANHAALFGQTCVGGAGPGGFDDRCPHKVLIRKEIDFGAATNFTNESTVEGLMTTADVNPYLTQPVGYNCAGMSGEPGMQNAKIVARGLLTFTVNNSGAGAITVNTRAVAIARARAKVALGTVPLFDSPFTHHFSTTVVPSVP